MNFVRKLFNALYTIYISKRNLFSFFKQGASISSTQIMFSCKKYISKLNTIIDVGANKGQFALAANHFFPDALIFSFEPAPNSYKNLVNNTKLKKNICTFNFALGNNNGEVDFHLNNYTHASSILTLSDLQKSVSPKTRNHTDIKVQLKKLDDLKDNIEISKPSLLKLDVQGYEKEVILGAEKILNEIDYLLVEASFVPMYEGETLFNEMNEFLKKYGFILIAPVGFLQSKDLQILQMDMLYKKELV